MAHYIDYNQTDGSTPTATLNRVGSVKPDGTSIDISANGTISANSGYISTQAMPSNRYDNLTVLASGQEYTVPANGYVFAFGAATASAMYIRLSKLNDNFGIQSTAFQNSQGLRIYMPVKKNDSFIFHYTNVTNLKLVFVYAEGESNV